MQKHRIRPDPDPQPWGNVKEEDPKSEQVPQAGGFPYMGVCHYHSRSTRHTCSMAYYQINDLPSAEDFLDSCLESSDSFLDSLPGSSDSFLVNNLESSDSFLDSCRGSSVIFRDSCRGSSDSFLDSCSCLGDDPGE